MKKRGGFWIKADGTEEAVESAAATWGLEELQKLAGGYIEVVAIPGDQAKIMLVNEDGLAERLKLNREASRIAGRPIVGDAVIIRRSDLR